MAETDGPAPKDGAAAPKDGAAAPKDGAAAPKDMDRWLGDGGMPIIGLVGGAFTTYGVDGEDLGWAGGTFTPTELACNPHGITQAGIHSLLARCSDELRHQRSAAPQGPDSGHARNEDRVHAPGQAGGLLRSAG